MAKKAQSAVRRVQPKVYLCHRSVDAPWVHKLAWDLRRYGVDAWLDEWDMPPGVPLTDAMAEGIDTADTMLLVLTKSSVKAIRAGKGGVAFEVHIAEGKRLYDANFRIIGILREECDPPEKLRNRLGRWLNFTSDDFYPARLRELVSWLQGQRVGPPVGEDTVPLFDQLGEKQQAQARQSVLALAVSRQATRLHDAVVTFKRECDLDINRDAESRSVLLQMAESMVCHSPGMAVINALQYITEDSPSLAGLTVMFRAIHGDLYEAICVPLMDKGLCSRPAINQVRDSAGRHLLDIEALIKSAEAESSRMVAALQSCERSSEAVITSDGSPTTGSAETQVPPMVAREIENLEAALELPRAERTYRYLCEYTRLLISAVSLSANAETSSNQQWLGIVHELLQRTAWSLPADHPYYEQVCSRVERFRQTYVRRKPAVRSRSTDHPRRRKH